MTVNCKLTTDNFFGNDGGGTPFANIAAATAEQSAEMAQKTVAIAEIAANFAKNYERLSDLPSHLTND